jgi:hypothetical protein
MSVQQHQSNREQVALQFHLTAGDRQAPTAAGQVRC